MNTCPLTCCSVIELQSCKFVLVYLFRSLRRVYTCEEMRHPNLMEDPNSRACPSVFLKHSKPFFSTNSSYLQTPGRVHMLAACRNGRLG